MASSVMEVAVRSQIHNGIIYASVTRTPSSLAAHQNAARDNHVRHSEAPHYADPYRPLQAHGFSDRSLGQNQNLPFFVYNEHE